MYINKNSIILKTVNYAYSKKELNQDNVLNIAYGIDKNFQFGCAISISSILLHNPNSHFHFHIFTDYQDDDLNIKLQQLAQQYSTQISIYYIDGEELKTFPNTKNWSYATYFRFLIADLLYPQIQKLLYIDADIICKGPLDELINMELQNYLAAVVLEGDENWWQKCAYRLDCQALKNGYFNAGLLYVNLKKWNENQISQYAIELLNKPEIRAKLDYLDQDLLNLLFDGNVLFIDEKYNQKFSINYELKAPKGTFYKNPIVDDTILIHYIGPTKPWHEWSKAYPCTLAFNNAKNQSPWKNQSLLLASNANHYRYCAKHKLHQGLFFSGLIDYIIYFKKKIFK